MRRSRWVHFVFGFFAGSVVLVVFILALSLPPEGEDREVVSWVFTGVGTFVIGTWVLIARWLKRRETTAPGAEDRRPGDAITSSRGTSADRP
jgi:hypothetical protein